MSIGETLAHPRASRKIMAIIGAASMFSSSLFGSTDVPDHTSTDKVYTQSVSDPVIIHLLPDCLPLTVSFTCEPPSSTTTSTTETTTTTVTLPPTTTTEMQPAPPPDTAPPAPAPTEEEWQAPEGCMAPMGPTEAKSIDEAHYCWDGLLSLSKFRWSVNEAFRIMYCESKGNPYADNPSSTANGLMQILDGPSEPYANVSLAYDMYVESGWKPWVCA